MTDKYEKYIKGLDFSKMPDVARPSMSALGQSQYGEEIDQICPRCNSERKVEPKTLKNELKPCAWYLSCECGACNGSFRGL
jgi:hypothetical protein